MTPVMVLSSRPDLWWCGQAGQHTEASTVTGGFRARGQGTFIEEGLLWESVWAPEGKVRLWRASGVRPGSPDHLIRV